MLPIAPGQSTLLFRRLLIVIKQTAYEEYSQLKLRGQAPKALRWKRLESRYKSHKQCVNDLLGVLRHHKAEFSCVNRVELDRQHLSNVDLVIAVGGDGTVLSAAHFLDHGTIPLLGINSDPISLEEKSTSAKKKVDERRSHGALCMCTTHNMHEALPKVLYGQGRLSSRTRIQCIVKSTFAETKLVPALNDLLIANPSPAAVSRFRMGWLQPAEIDEKSSTSGPPSSWDGNPAAGTVSRYFRHGSTSSSDDATAGKNDLSTLRRNIPSSQYGTVTRFSGIPYDCQKSLNVWSSGLWLSTSTGSTAAMKAAGGQIMDLDSQKLQYLIREHIIEENTESDVKSLNNLMIEEGEQLYLRWNSQRGRIFIDGSHLTHELELGDEILINNQAPPLLLFMREDEDGNPGDMDSSHYFDNITY